MSDNDLHVVRLVSSSRERLWDLWTDPNLLTQWWWPARFQTTYRVDCLPGGSYRYTTGEVPPMGVLDLAGTFQEVDRPRKLRYTWRWESDLGDESTVTVELVEADPDQTEIRIHHEGLRDVEDRDNHIVGWNDCLDRLEGLAGQQD